MRLGIARGIQNGVGIAVAPQETLEPQQPGIGVAPDQNRPGPAFGDQSGTAQDVGTHDQLAQLGRSNQQRAQMGGVECQRLAPF